MVGQARKISQDTTQDGEMGTGGGERKNPKGRTTWYESVAQMQTDLDAYLVSYNTTRPYQCRGMNGRPLEQVFKAGFPSKNPQRGQQRKPPDHQAIWGGTVSGVLSQRVLGTRRLSSSLI